MGPGATIAGSASSTGGVAAEGRPLYLWETMVCADGRKRGAMSTEVVVEIDEGCARKARFAPAHSRELAQPRARKRGHAKETPGFLPRRRRGLVATRLQARGQKSASGSPGLTRLCHMRFFHTNTMTGESW